MKASHFYTTVIRFVLVITFFTGALTLKAQCPVIQFEDLRDVIGFPQFDNTSQCGDADTLSLLVFTDAPGEILGFDLTVNLENGIQYGGFEDTQFGGNTSIAYAGGTPTSPKFSLSGVTDPENVMVANIGIGANCDLDLATLYIVSFEYEYIYQDTMGNIIECEGTYTLSQELNSGLKRPELNMNTVSPVTRVLTSLATPYCQTMQVSQDGLQANLQEMNFAVCNFPTVDPNLAIVSVKANSIDLPFAVEGDSSITAMVDGSYFLTNTSPNPTNEQFNTGEKITFEVCYQSDLCPSSSIFNPVYKAWYGCEGDTCNITSQTATVRVQPTGAVDPTATVSFDGPLEICGAAGTISLTVTNPGGAGLENTYTDVSVGYETCERTNLGIAAVRVAGVALTESDYDWIGDDLTVNFDSLPMIPESGLTDVDGDGFFDDLEGGATVTLEIDMEIVCGITEVDPTSLECPSVNCPFATFFVKAKSNCGNTFNRFPDVDAFNINYGPTGVENNNEVNIGTDNNPIQGYDFGIHGTSGSNMTPLAPAVIDYEFCYEFASENVTPCPTGADYGLKLTFSGSPRIVQDYEVVPGSITFSADGGADVAISDASATFMTPDPSDMGIRMLTIEGGAANDMVCYKMQIQLDTAYCSPPQFVAVSQQVLETCPDCTSPGDDCTIVKACKNTQFKSDPSYYDCPCLVGHNIEVTRKNLGYTDHTMTTKVDRQTILDNCPADLTNFGPGDTMAVCVAFDIKDIDAVTDMNMWLFSARIQSTSGLANTEELPLTPDRRAGGIVKWEVIKSGGTATEFSFGDFASCDSRTGDLYDTNDERDGNEREFGFPAYSDRGLQDLTTDFDVPTTFPGNSSHDGYDNTINTYLYVRNATQSNECGAVSTSSGGNCLQEFFDAFDFQVGDTIKMYMEYPMKRNPYRAAAIAAGESPAVNNGMLIRNGLTMYNYDEFGNASYCYTTNSSSCNSHPIVNVAEYGGVSAVTELDLDNCGGAAKHTFKIANPAPTGWYQCEFRPIANIDDVDAPMFGPFAYCSNAKVTDYDGNESVVSVDSTINSYCTTVASVTGDICATEDAGLGDGKVVFDLSSQGVRALGVGLMNDDSLCLSYDLCALCPAPFTIDYELIYDWSDICSAPRDPQGYRCNTAGANGIHSYCPQNGVVGNWYIGLDLDTIMYKLDESSKDFIVNDNRIPDAGMSSSNQGADLVASGAPGTSIEYQEIELCNADGTATQMDVAGSVTVPNSVMFVGAFSDAAGTTALPTALVSDDGTYKTYSITTNATTLAPTACETVYIATTLLFCPVLPAPPPQICVSATSGCAPPDVTTALAGSGTCGSGEDCYAYIAGEADLQTEWYNTPTTADLCMTDTFYVRVKNTKQLTLLNLETVVNIPPGVNIVPGSWEAAYPGGTVGLTGNFGDWTAISPQPSADGNSYSFVDADYSAEIASTGLPGVFTTIDSNTVSFRFIATTECDNFISGAKFTTETTAADPCGPGMLESGLVDSPPLIISGADPADNAQILTTAQPKEAYCTGGPTAFGLTALNISEKSTSDSVQTCLTIPMESLTYVTGSISFTSPSYTPTMLTEEVVGGDMVVCFDSPALMPGQKFSLEFMADQPEDALCGPILVGMDVKSFEAAVVCESAPDMVCGVFVQNSINSALVFEMGPPLETVDVRINRQCNSSTDPEQFCYEVDMVNPGDMNYTGDIRIGIHDDVLADGLYDAIVDAELAGFDHAAVSVDAGAMVTLMMCLDVPAAQACPIILRQSFETGCACDEATTPFDNIPPAFLDTLECQVLCAGQPFMTDICGDYVFTLEPAAGGTIVSDGSTLSVTLNSGFGVDAPVVLTATEAIGDCVSEATLELKSTGDYAPVDLAFQVCEGECIDPNLMIPENISEGSTIEITQAGAATMGDDLDMSDPEVCGITPGMTDTYTVTITASPTCTYTFDFTVEVLPIGVLTLTDETVCNHPLFGGTIEADATFDNYQFFLVLPNGAEVLKYSGPLNTYNTDVDGDYVVKATSAANMCPSVASANISSDNCVDLALKKELVNVPPYPAIGDLVQYRLRVYNQGGVTINNFELTDSVPTGMQNADPLWNPAAVTGGLVTQTVVVPAPGLVAGDSIDVFITLELLAGADATNTTNIAEISNVVDENGDDVSDEDIDSTPDGDLSNDPGGNPDSPSDNTVDGDGTNGGGAPGDQDPATDEDDNDPATLPIFDLALSKTVDPTSVPASGMFTVGDPITFIITVENQGTVDATNVVVKDLIPCGMEMFDDSDPINVAEGWGAAVADANSSSGFGTSTTVPALAAGASIQIPIKMTLALPTGGTGNTPCVVGMDPYLNIGFIDSAEDDMGNVANDIDSNPGDLTPEEESVVPNMNGDNDTASTGNGEEGSQDDSDPANIQIFDLALSKILEPDNGPYAYGDVATFEICVTNQGNVPTDSVQIVDYIPAGYMFDPANSAQWTDNGDGTATWNSVATDFDGNSMLGQIGFLEQVCTSIDLIVQSAGGDPMGYINTAEIAGATTVVDPDMGGPLDPISTFVTEDNDGSFDTDPADDAGGALDTPSDAMTSDPTDPAIQGDGTGAPGDEDPATDSDDSDIAGIDIVDFALTKMIESPDAPYAYGDTVTFKIKVYNQGTVTGENITVTDYAPIGLEYLANPIDNPGWTGIGASHSYMLPGPIVPGGCDSVFVKMVINQDGSTTADYTNIAEISSVFDEDGNNITNDDVDSTPDANPFNDGGGAADTDSDDTVDGDGTGTNGDEDPLTDEDDNDPAFVQIFDLAQTKEIVGGPYTIGDLVEYKITTINQGNAPVTNVVVNDYVPAGLVFSPADNADWMFVGPNPTGNTVSTTITDVIEPGMMVMTSLFLTIQSSNGDPDAYTNYTEISSFEDTNGNSSLTDPTIADADSTPDDDPVNDAGGNPDTDTDGSVDGDGTGDPLGEDPLTDEDDQDPAMLSIPDLALIKTTSETGPFSYGDIVTFDISIINQGNVVASNVEVTDYIPDGFIYESSNDALWSYDGTVATTTIAGPVNPGDSIPVSIDLMVTQAADPTDAYTNEAEISMAFEEDGTTPFDDVDSTPDGDNTNDAGGSPLSDSDNSVDGTGTNGMGAPDDTDGTTDEDDADPELIAVVDVAQTKMLVSTAPFNYGDELEFVITTYNQGNIPLTDVVITDYIPAGFSLAMTSEDAGWLPSAAGAEFTITDVILPGESLETTIFLVLEMTTGGDDNYTNVSEVSMMSDTTGVDVSDADADSNINNDPSDNGGGEPGTGSDDVVDGDGTGMPGDEDAATDEDNSDPAFVEIFDLAVTLGDPTDPITMYGQVVTYPVIIDNQGNVPSDSTAVTIAIPDGFVFDPVANPDWVDNGDGTITYASADPILPGESDMVDLILEVQPTDDPTGWDLDAEITLAQDENGDALEDIDSTPGDNSSPFDEDANDLVDGDTIGDSETDGGDDQDPAFIEIFDLAVTLGEPTDPITMYGQDVTYPVTIDNQGNVTSDSTEVTIAIPDGFIFDPADNPDWVDNGDGTITYVSTDPILPGESDMVDLILEVQPTDDPTGWDLDAEITLAQDENGDDLEDIDSTPGDNATPFDEANDDDTTDIMGGDDQDPAFIEIFDLAVTLGDPEDPTMYGEDVTYPVIIDNQGNVTSDSTEVTIAIPDGFIFDPLENPDWVDNGDGTITYASADPILPGESDMVDLVLEVQPTDDPTGWDLDAEITLAQDENGDALEDIDSTPGDNSSPFDEDANDLEDTDTIGDSEIDGGDDQDPAFIEIFDLAVTLGDPADPTMYGEDLTYPVIIDNQGNVTSDSTEVTIAIPDGFIFDPLENPDWVDNGDGTITYASADPILPGESDMVDLVLEVQPTDDPTGWDLDAEITLAQDENGDALEDIDSTPGDNSSPFDEDANDLEDADTVGDSELDGGDDQDPAFIEIFDLAVILGDPADQITMYGQEVTYPVIIENQGNVPSDSTEVTITIPDGFVFDPADNPDWVDNGDGTITYASADPILPGENDMVDLILTVQATDDPAGWDLDAEITLAQDEDGVALEDIDSTPGDNSSPFDEAANDLVATDTVGVSETDGGDDQDPAFIEVFDLALTKVTMMTTGNSFGDTIEFMITVYNQGNVPTTNVEVTDFMPDGFGYVMANDTAGWVFEEVAPMTATTTIMDTIQPGESYTLSYFVTIMMSNMGDAFQNQAEISKAEDDNGNSTADGSLVDADSTPDAINGNDPGGEPGTDSDNSIDGDGTNGGGSPGDTDAATDEDDSDPALIQVIDVAIQKTIVDGQAPFAYGTPVDFLIKVINQGNEPLVDVEVTDYIPAGYTYDTASDANGWTYDGTNATTVIEGPMVQWDSTELIITLIPEQQIPSDNPDAWTNVAEVSQMFDEDGNDISMDDIDSQADNDPTNDPGGEPGSDSDDSVDGDGNNGGGAAGDTDADSDEDDADPALLPVFDLALTKQLANPDSLYLFGDEMEFVIEVTNQGNQPVTNVTVTDYIPGSLTDAGVVGDNTGWTFNGATAEYIIMDTIPAGESVEVTLFMVFQAAAGGIDEYINVAEISEFADTLGNNSTDNADLIADADSTPDAIEDNDTGGEPDYPGAPSGSDNTIDNEVVDGIADEDDSDPVLLGFVDMALVKTLVDPTTPIQVGNDVTFAIEVTNQGTIPMVDVEVIDYIPAGFELSANDTNDWEATTDGNATNIVDGPLGFGESETLNIVLTVLPNAQADNMVNVAELTSFFFESGVEATDLDIDSQADSLSMNDAGGDVYGDSDDALNGDGTGMPGDNDPLTDEDDSDPAVPNVLDLALTKTIDPMTPAVRPGDVVTFTIEVCNQGNIPVDEVTVYDDVPAGLLKSPNAADGWNLVDGTTWAYVIEERLERDACTTVEIELEVLPNSSPAEMINVAEIAQVIDTAGVDVSAYDIDSTPNDDAGEAAGTLGTADDDSTDGSVPNGGDSDDADPAAPPMMDLAIQKINPVVGPSTRGDVVPFEITVFNQGNMVAQDIEVTDYIPAGLEATADNTGWTVSGSLATYTVAELLPGTDTTIVINLEILQSATPMNVVNMSEVSSATDTLGIVYSGGGNDYDSDYDADNTNDVGNEIYDFDNNDVVDEYGIGHGADGIDDEDDHDQAWVLLCDGMSCKGDLNLSIDSSTCSAEITAEMLLTGDIFPNHIYNIILKDENDNEIANPVTSEYIGQKIIAEIYNPLCGNNTCWLPILVEYKYKPQIICVENDTLSCTQAFSESTIEPDVSMNCGAVTLQLVDETSSLLDCDTLFSAMLVKKWVATDEYGNVSDTCSSTIFLERTNLDEIISPQPAAIFNDAAISCSSGFATTDQGYPFPALSVTGGPRLNTDDGYVDIFPFSAGSICNGYAEFTDVIMPNSTSCVTKILRTFTIGEWWCGGTNEMEFKQLIEIVDFDGPEITCPSDMTVSTGSFECTASVSVPLPAAADACNNDLVYNIGTPVGDFENYNGESFTLPAGVHTISYAVYDACEQGSFCSFTVTVVDNADPIAICDQFTEVSLSLETTTSVPATSIDDGSFDECGPVTLSVARMDDPGFEDFTGFGPEVDITCADAGQTVMVGLLVTDAGGNTNMCMVSVAVKDKVEAQMVCPADTTVECNFAFDPDNLSAFFGEVQIFDNCPSSNTIDEVMVGELNTCGSGVLTRQITLLNAQGVATDYCEQTITFVSGSPLQYSDITPPNPEVEVDGCGIGALEGAGITMPIIPDGVCQQVAMAIDNDTFPFAEEGACLKIIRTYKVIDWCITDGPGSAGSPWEFEQIIKVNNTVKPVFTDVFTDSTYCSYAGDCGGLEITGLTATSTDDCTLDSDLIRTYETRNASGTIVKFGNGHDASGDYDLGDYTVRFIAEDKCGNQQVTESTFSIISCKQPVPYCLDGLSTSLTLMDPDEDGEFEAMVMLNTDFFDAGSYHPCGLDVTLSFSADTTDKIIVFDCAGLGDQEVELWVTDSNGNQDYCVASLDVQDNEGLCGNKPANIQGRIYTAADAELNEAMVQLISAEIIADMTDVNGEYGFMNMPQGGSYSLAPTKDDDVLNGVSTLDLVMIQRHILGIAPFEEAYKYIAADINHDDKLTASDLVSLRKTILGVNTHFTNNTSWRFIDEAHEFEDETDPWSAPFAETYDIAELTEDMWVDFVAVKVGDINGNVDANLQAGIISEIRSAKSLVLALPDTEVERDEVYEIDVLSSDAVNLRGLQLALAINGLEFVEIKQGAMNIKISDIVATDREIKMSYANAVGDYARSEDVLYTLVFRATENGQLSEMIEIESKSLNAEAYLGDDLKVGSVEIEWRAEEVVMPVQLLVAGAASPNPWRSQTEIKFEIPSEGDVNLIIRDASGRVLYTKSDKFAEGKQSFTITNDDVNVTGVLLYELQYGEQVVHKKMIRIE